MLMLQSQASGQMSIERKFSMERTLTYPIDNSISPLPVSQFLRQKGFSMQSLTQLKKDPAAVLADGMPCFMNHVLQPGEVLTIHILEKHSSEKIPPVDLPLNILYEDEDLMVINKPAGMPIHPSMNHYYNSLANGLAYYFEQQNCPFVFRCINRLDRDTSGLTLIAKHYISSGMLSTMITNKAVSGITREYLAIVKGTVTPQEGTITAPLSRKEGSIIERTVDFEKGESAITHYKILDVKNGHSLVSLILETGRTHQIRIHMKYLGYPLIGDYLYNPDMELIQRQALHAWKLSFRHPITGEGLHFTAPLPEDMAAVLTV
jgi:23S rRNA pseudouridine1911/1915/1917 synthase